MSDLVLVDVTPLTLDIETLGGVITPLITRHTPRPVKRTARLTTAADMQTNVTVHVGQGERLLAADHTSLGVFCLHGLPLAPRGGPTVAVTCAIEARGLLSISARDTATGTSQSIRITGSTRLSENDTRRMLEEAERYAEADRQRRQAVEQLNAIKALSYQAERTLIESD